MQPQQEEIGGGEKRFLLSACLPLWTKCFWADEQEIETDAPSAPVPSLPRGEQGKEGHERAKRSSPILYYTRNSSPTDKNRDLPDFHWSWFLVESPPKIGGGGGGAERHMTIQLTRDDQLQLGKAGGSHRRMQNF